MKDGSNEPVSAEDTVGDASQTRSTGQQERAGVAVRTRRPRRAWSLVDGLLLLLLATIGALLVLAGGNLLLRAAALVVVLGGAYWLFEAR